MLLGHSPREWAFVSAIVIGLVVAAVVRVSGAMLHWWSQLSGMLPQ